MNYHMYFNKETGKKVQTITRATAIPTMQDVVCYQELYDDYDFFVMSREEFSKKFTRELEGLPVTPRKEIERRVEIPQKVKKIGTTLVESTDTETNIVESNKTEKNDILMRFLDAELYDEKVQILRGEIDNLDDKILNNIIACLDLSIDSDVDKYEYILQNLEIQKRYEGSRLR